MQFEWDDKKARLNKAKHGIDFEAVHAFDFDTALYVVDEATDYGEERILATGLIGARFYTMVFTERDERIRVISLRRATKTEIRKFYER
jgi:uncharacterized DUF497 family protein